MGTGYLIDDERDEIYPTRYDAVCPECLEWRPIEDFEEEGGVCRKCLNELEEGGTDDSEETNQGN